MKKFVVVVRDYERNKYKGHTEGGDNYTYYCSFDKESDAIEIVRELNNKKPREFQSKYILRENFVSKPYSPFDDPPEYHESFA